ncbi:MAG: S9 family peptidase, partial [Bacteroidales bacterium]|nr:S9 family peptidase [Bacteroidales bacterium]
ESGNNLKDHLKWIKFSDITWNGNGFYYTRFPNPNNGDPTDDLKAKLCYHKLGTPQSSDEVVYENNSYSNINIRAEVFNNRYLIISESIATSGCTLAYKDLSNPNSEIVKIVDTFDYDFYAVDEVDGKLLVLTNYFAPHWKLIQIYMDNISSAKWLDLLPESDNATLVNISHIGNKLIANYTKDAHSLIRTFDENGNFLGNLDNEEIGTIHGFDGAANEFETFYTVKSYAKPPTIYRYDVETNKSTLYKKCEINFDSDDYITEQKVCTSKDGTQVPMFITHKKGIKLDGNNPTLLFGYGGFNMSLTPFFKATRLVWLEQGGIYVEVNTRGGGEYGQKWHEAGTLLKKQNVFDDFIAAAEY